MYTYVDTILCRKNIFGQPRRQHNQVFPLNPGTSPVQTWVTWSKRPHKWILGRQMLPPASSKPEGTSELFSRTTRGWRVMALGLLSPQPKGPERQPPGRATESLPMPFRLQGGCVSAEGSARGATRPRWISAGKTRPPAKPHAQKSRQRWAPCPLPMSWSHWRTGSCSLP